MQERQIVNNNIMVQEAIHSSRENKDKGMIIKINMANAFDKVRHSFMFVVLFKFGFSLSCRKRLANRRTTPGNGPNVAETQAVVLYNILRL
jgi:hypothetical protein